MQLQQIAERCQQGDREAFAQLYTAMRQPLRTVCLSYVHDEDVADDLLHDAFLLIFYQIGQLKDTTRAESWMTKLTRRVALLYLRQKRRQHQEPLSACAATVLPSPMVENRAESSLALQEILAAVNALPDGYRRVFRLFVLEGMTHQEIAALLHIDPHSSSSQLFHARALLRRWLRPMVLLLLAVALPLGVWHWHKSLEQTDVEPIPSPPAVRNLARQIPPDTLLDRQKTLQKGKSPVKILQREEHLVENLPRQIPSDTVLDKQKTLQREEHPVENLPRQITPPTKIKGGDWLLSVTYSGTGNSRDMRLPYASAETNPVVYDSVAHHHRPLTVGLMLNRRLGDHWQVGIGLNYQRLTSDMRSGNTYVTLSQHQVVQYIGLPVSLSWHYPLSRRFSTYLSASATVSLPLRSTLESVYIMDGQLYEPATERLHPTAQWSTGLGLGLQYDLTPHVGVFAEPGLHYHFNGSKDNVKTWRTEHPLDFSLPLGLRITF